jgi:predicted transcriptional regulator
MIFYVLALEANALTPLFTFTLKIEKIDVHPTITTIIENYLQHNSTLIGVVALGGCIIASYSGRTLRLKQQIRLK